MAVGAVLLAVAAAAPGAQAATPVVNPSADLAAQPPDSPLDLTYVDSIYTNSLVQGGGHTFVITLDVAALPNLAEQEVLFSIYDETTGWYDNSEVSIPADEFSWSTTGLDLTAGGVTITGSAQQINVAATTSVGTFNVQLTPQGSPLYYSGTGITQLLSDTNYEYAFPKATTTGTLTADGGTYPVSGTTWFDRQWGPEPLLDPTMQWTWMGLTLSNGDEVAIWDILDATGQNSFATVLEPDGSTVVASVTPLASGASDYWTSSSSLNSYPAKWNITIPSLSASLIVTKTGTGQEFPDPEAHVEASGSVTGTFGGSAVTGSTFLEQNGNWLLG
jgi:hypothetical protein